MLYISIFSPTWCCICELRSIQSLCDFIVHCVMVNLWQCFPQALCRPTLAANRSLGHSSKKNRWELQVHSAFSWFFCWKIKNRKNMSGQSNVSTFGTWKISIPISQSPFCFCHPMERVLSFIISGFGQKRSLSAEGITWILCLIPIFQARFQQFYMYVLKNYYQLQLLFKWYTHNMS